MSGLRVYALPRHQAGKEAAPFDQRVVAAVLHDPAAVEHKDTVTVTDGGEPVGNDHPCAAHGVQRLGDLPLRPVVQRARRLVKEQELRLRRDRARDHQPLLLSAGDAASALGDHRIHPHGHGSDIVGDPGRFRGFPGLVDGEARRSENDIGVDIALEEAALLHNGTDLPAQGTEIQALDVLAVVVDRTLFRLFKAQQQTHERGLAAARPSYDGHVFAGPYLQRQIVESREMPVVKAALALRNIGVL